MRDICQIVPKGAQQRDIAYYNFVYEAELDRLAQPFFRKNICMQLAFKGSAVLKMDEKEYALTPGTLFVTFPNRPYEITDSDNFTFLYITFGGEGALKLLRQFGIDQDHGVYYDFGHLTDFWMTAIRRVNPANILVLTESVLLYTLSFVGQHKSSGVRVSREFDGILDYIQNNFADPELSVSKVADLFGFSGKYLSALFVKNMQMKFTDYLAKTRIEQAAEILQKEKLSVAELAARCGYTDPFYFSKVFKSLMGIPPSQYPPKS
ncbi:MAG: helix-turn-helix transcriptional regulator [Oscillospiraceae bacterium]|nr:helix-turn-helix transcriptional regulator [Oscillospiraceae bacterium]